MSDGRFSVTASAVPNGEEWYVIHSGEDLGPFSRGELAEQAVAGRIKPDDLIKPNGGLWTKAGDVSFLQEHFLVKETRQRATDGRFHGIWVSRRALGIGLSVSVAVILLTGVLVVKNLNDAQQRQRDSLHVALDAEDRFEKLRRAGNLLVTDFDRVDKELKRLQNDRKGLENEIARLRAELALLEDEPEKQKPQTALEAAKAHHRAVFAKVQKFVDEHPKIQSKDFTISQVEWDSVTRPFRTKTSLSRFEQEQLLDFLGRAIKHAPYDMDPSIPRAISELKSLKL